ncbi:hypothetical protein BREVNS_1525 [Brevinematales bacterium NS]|nr:hypothetical protein [Brevinematales bacterium]QJR22275.1 hypothetical protein BREVNS_1525 [Brevinematales bacterium NS]
MSRKVFWLGIVVITLCFLCAFVLVYQGENGKEGGEEGVVRRVERFLYEVYKGEKKPNGDNLIGLRNETNVFFVLNVFLNTQPEIFLSQEWIQFWKTNDDVKLMLAIAEKRLGRQEYMQHFELEKLVFKMNYYRYAQLFGLSSIGRKDFLNLKKLVVYAHDNDFLDVAVDVATNLLTLSFVDPEVMSYYGSTLTKYALIKNSPVDKVDFVSKGSYYIDRAVNEYPDFLIPRFVRVFNYLSLPSFFKKGKFVEEDLSILLSNYQHDKKMRIVINYAEVEEVEIPLAQLREIKRRLRENKVLSTEKRKVYIEMIEKMEK